MILLHEIHCGNLLYEIVHINLYYTGGAAKMKKTALKFWSAVFAEPAFYGWCIYWIKRMF